MRALQCFGLAGLIVAGGCSSSNDCSESVLTKPGDSLLAGLHFDGAAVTSACGKLKFQKNDNVPTSLGGGDGTGVIAPGGMVPFAARWSGGAAKAVNISFGGNQYIRVPLAVGVDARSTVLPAQIAKDVCNNLPTVCHALKCCMQIVTPSGTLSAPVALTMILDCTNGAGCPAQYGVPNGSCTIDDRQFEPTPMDLGVPPDLWMPGTAPTGAACSIAHDCADSAASSTSHARCLRGPNGDFQGGYCSNSCRIGMNDPKTTINPDCPGGQGTCLNDGIGAECYRVCHKAADDCRVNEGYYCAGQPGGVGTCMSTQLGSCDPVGMNCARSASGRRQQCVDSSVDGSGGYCVETCDVIAQDCTTASWCIADEKTGQGWCNSVGAGVDGTPCATSGDCTSGHGCHAGVCRRYCREAGTDGGPPVDMSVTNVGPADVPCKNGKACVDLSPLVPRSQIGICGG